MKNENTDKLAEESSKNFFHLVTSLLKKSGQFALDEIKIRKATDLYSENYERRYGSVKVLGMSRPVLLKDLYTEVHITNPSYKNKERIIGDLEHSFRASRGDFFSGLQRLSGLKLANQEKKLNVLGSPGSGKSTFLRKIALESLTTYNYPVTEKYEHECVPVLIELKRFKSEEVNLKSLIQKEFEIAGFPESTKFLERALKEGKLLVLLDGLDEVPELKLDDILVHIKNFTDQFHRNRFITSCRTAYYKNYLDGFTDVEITSFTNDQIQQFVKNWFSQEEDTKAATADLFQRLIFQETNEATLELARTPLLLAFLCMTFDETQRFPINRASLYKQALQILIYKWAAEKRIHNDDIYQDLNSEIETELLADVAAYFFQQDKIFFKSEDLKNRIKGFLDVRISPVRLNTSKILEAIEIQQGILVERSPNVYSFSHLTIQEYLTSHYFDSPLRIHELTKNYIFNKSWREVFLLLTGTGDPNDILELMIAQLKNYSKENKIIKDVAKWTELLSTLSSPEQAACRRIFLASLLIRFKRYDAGFPNQPERIEIYANELLQRVYSPFYDFFVHDLKENINPKQAKYLLIEINKWFIHPKNIDSSVAKISTIRPPMPLSKMLMGSRHSYRKEILDEFYKALEIPDELCNRRRDLYSPLLRYLQGFSLLLDCAKESSLTKKETIQKIYDSIFTIME